LGENNTTQREVQKSIASKYDNDDDGLSGEETDSCLLSIDEHLARRMSKWRQHKKSIGAPSRRKANHNAGFSLEDSTLETNSISTNEVTEDESHSETSYISVDDRAGNAEQVPQRNATLSPVEESLVSEESSGRLKYVEYVSKLDVASTNQDISTVEPMGKKQARAAFIPGRKVPREIKTTTFDETNSVDDVPPFDGMVLPTPPVDSFADHGFENEEFDMERGDARNSTRKSNSRSSRSSHSLVKEGSDTIHNNRRGQEWILGGRNEIELFFITIISLSLLVLVVLLIYIVANGK